MTYFDDAKDLPELKDGFHQRGEDNSNFQYWVTVLELEMVLLFYERSLRQASLTMYFDALTELVPRFYALETYTIHTMPGGSLFT